MFLTSCNLMTPTINDLNSRLWRTWLTRRGDKINSREGCYEETHKLSLMESHETWETRKMIVDTETAKNYSQLNHICRWLIIITIIKAYWQHRFLWFTPSVPIGHRSWNVLLTASSIHTELMNLSLFWSAKTSVSTCRSPYKKVAYVLVLILPAFTIFYLSWLNCLGDGK